MFFLAKRTTITPEPILSTFLHDVSMIPGICQACKQHFFVWAAVAAAAVVDMDLS